VAAAAALLSRSAGGQRVCESRRRARAFSHGNGAHPLC
jgi:hypothetical protein